MNKRDVEIRRREGRVAGAFIYGLDDEVNDSLPNVRRHRHIYDAQNFDIDEDGVVSLAIYLFVYLYTKKKGRVNTYFFLHV